MKLGIFVPSIGNYGNSKFYNTQEVGLAKELCKLFDEITIYRLIDIKNKYSEETLLNYENVKIILIPSRKIGSNGIINVSYIDNDIDAMICFSDLQIFVPRLYKWCKKNKIKFIPYVGTIESTSKSILK